MSGMTGGAAFFLPLPFRERAEVRGGFKTGENDGVNIFSQILKKGLTWGVD